jgi:hypothetical protein
MYDTQIQSRATESVRRRRRRRKVVVMVVFVVVNYYIAQRKNEECLIYLQQQRVNPAPGKKVGLLDRLLLLLLQGTCILYFRFISNNNRSFCTYARIFPSPFFL